MMTNNELAKHVELHAFRIRRPSLTHVRHCLFDVFGSDVLQWPQMTTTHRTPFRAGRVVVNELPGYRASTSSTDIPTMHSAGFSLSRTSGVLAVTASFAKPVIEGFEVHRVGLRGRTIYEDVPPSTGFIAMVGTDATTFGLAAFNQVTGVVENLSETTAFAVASHGLDRAFCCSN